MVTLSLKHEPVLLDKVIEYLDIQPGDIVVDGTIGLGGHSAKIAELVGSGGNVIGFDLDNNNLSVAQKRLKEYEGRLMFVNDSYNRIDHYFKALKLNDYNKVLLDLGLSSPHLDDPQRGFSFQNDGPLDMRFDKTSKLTADRILHKATQSQLEDILRNFGEVSNYKKVALMIVEERKKRRFRSTADFAARIEPALPKRSLHRVLAQIFQALRIAVNNELNVLQDGLVKLWDGMSKKGRMVVISYHSLEDRIVKRFFQQLMKSCVCPSSVLKCECLGKPQAKKLYTKLVTPLKAEVEANPRSRSAKLRAYQKLC